MVEETGSDAVARHRARNEKLAEKIRQLGGDLQDPRAIDFFFYAPDNDEAAALAGDLVALGFVNVRTGERRSVWAVTAERRASVNEIIETEFVTRLVSLAAKHRAEFDGWGTAV